MPITLAGNWTIEVYQKNPQALPQRFIVSGATFGNGTYVGEMGAPSVPITGQNWQLNIQANESYEMDGQWLNSTIVPGTITVQGGYEVLMINSEDLVQDNSFDDLVLRLTRAVVPNPPPPPPPPPPVEPPIIQPPVVPPIIIPVIPEPLGVGKVWTIIDPDDILPRETETVIKGIWSNGSGSLVTFYTGSIFASQSFKLQVYQEYSASCPAEPQFDIAYGHAGGSGSNDLGGFDWLSPSKAIYDQYRQLCLPANQKKFKIGNRELNHIYAINIRRDKMYDRVDEGNIELNIAHLSGSLFQTGGGTRNAHTGSNVKLAGNNQVLRLIDDSNVNLKELSTGSQRTDYIDFTASFCRPFTEAGEMFFLISGSLEEGTVFTEGSPTVYGLSYPRLGVLILDGDKLDGVAGFLTVTGSDVNGHNAMKLFTAISGAANFTDASGDRLGFQARRTEYHHSQYFFIRVKNQDYNFTNNQTYISGSDQYLIDDFKNNHKVYITSVGLYDDNHELLAIGKLSKPILKTFTDEALLTLRLSY